MALYPFRRCEMGMFGCSSDSDVYALPSYQRVPKFDLAVGSLPLRRFAR